MADETTEPEVIETAIPPREPCLCGCGLTPLGKKARFIPGHDAKLRSRLVNAARAGDKAADKQLGDLKWDYLPA